MALTGYYSSISLHTVNLSLYAAGDIEDEDEVLAWLTDEDTLEIPGRIEEVNIRMLERILEENSHVVVFFCEYKTWNISLVEGSLNEVVHTWIFNFTFTTDSPLTEPRVSPNICAWMSHYNFTDHLPNNTGWFV